MTDGRPTPPWAAGGSDTGERPYRLVSPLGSVGARNAPAEDPSIPPMTPEGTIDIFRPEIPPRRAGQTVGWVAAAIAIPILFLALTVVGAIVGYAAVAISAESTGMSPDIAVDSSDAALISSILGQVLALIVFLPLWIAVRRRAFGPAHATRPRGVRALRATLGVVAAGLGVQLSVSHLLDFVLQFLPDLAAEYASLMEGSGISELSVLSALTVAILAPIVEEVACRGLVFEFLMRAMHRGWNPRTGARDVEPTRVAVVASILLTSLIFGALHLNLVQASYAFPMGVLLSWVYWRTGNLGYSIGLHLVVNFSSYGVEVAGAMLEPLGAPVPFILGAVLLAAGVFVFGKATRQVGTGPAVA